MATRVLLITAWVLMQVSLAVAGLSGLAVAGLSGPAAPAGALEAARQTVLAAPLTFTPNAGQWDGQVFFGAKSSQGDLYFLRRAVVLALPDGAGPPRQVRLEPLGMGPDAAPAAGGPARSVTNYFIGNDPANWRLGVTGCDAVRYQGVYPGIDLRFHGDRRSLEYDFVVAPGADPGQIKVRLAGAESLHLSAEGGLVATLPGGRELRQDIPAIYQDIDGERRAVAGRFSLAGESDGAPVFGFEVAAYDPGHTLVIDPTITYSMYIGGVFNDVANAMAVDTTGAYVYAAGSTLSSLFPGDGSAAATRTATDVFVARYATDGSGGLTTTVLVGSAADTANAIAVDATGVYITGSTLSSDFPVTLPLFASRTGTKADAFITKLNLALSSRLFSTYFGGTGTDSGQAIAVGTDALYVAGYTDSQDLPVKNAYASQNAGSEDGFVLKLRLDGSLINYATYFGGEKNDRINGLAVSDDGDAYFVGDTLSTKLPVNHPLQTTIGGGKDAFVARLGATGTELIFSTWLGGSATDTATSLVLDQTTNIFLTGSTNSTNFPVTNALYATKAGDYDAFLTKIDKTGRFITFSTLLGGLDEDSGKALAVDMHNDPDALRYIYLGGQTASANFPVDNPWKIDLATYKQNGNGFRGVSDGFLVKFDPNGRRIVHSSFLGGTAADSVLALATNPAAARTVYLTGSTASPSSPATTGFPIVGPLAGEARGLLGGGKTTGTPPLTSVVDVTGQSDPFITTVTDTGYSNDLPVLALSVAAAAPQSGSSVSLNLAYTDAATASGINNVSTVLTYDALLLEPTDVTTTRLAPYQLDWQDNGAGTLHLSLSDTSGATALAAGTLATVTFRVKYAGTSTATMVTNTATAANVSDRETFIQGVPGLVTISEHCSMIGDCDCSGTVKIWEVQYAARMLLDPPNNTEICLKTDYLNMTSVDMQLIINSHLYRTAMDPVQAAKAITQPDRSAGQATLRLSTQTANETTMTANLALATGGTAMSIIVADIAFDSTQFSDVAVTAGPSVQAAGKEIRTNLYEPGKLRLIILGLGNRTSLEDGTLANLVLTRRVPGQTTRGTLKLTADVAAPDATSVSVNAPPLTYQGPLTTNIQSAINLLLQ